MNINEKHKCKYCGASFSVAKYRKKTFCNQICHSKYIVEQNWSGFLDAFNKGELKWRGQIRKVMVKTREHKCELCKNTTWQGQPIPLQIDHIDGNATNNMPDNLRFICHNCDALLPTFAGRNRGNGRQSRGLSHWS